MSRPYAKLTASDRLSIDPVTQEAAPGSHHHPWHAQPVADAAQRLDTFALDHATEFLAQLVRGSEHLTTRLSELAGLVLAGQV